MTKDLRWSHEPCGTSYDYCRHKDEHMAYHYHTIKKQLEDDNRELRKSIFKGLICRKCGQSPKYYEGGVEGNFISCKCYSKEFPGTHIHVLWGYTDPPKDWTDGIQMKVETVRSLVPTTKDKGKSDE